MGFLRKKKQEGAGRTGRGVSIVDALMLMSQGATVADVRGTREFERGHLPGSRLVDPKLLRTDPVAAVWGDDPLADTSKPVIVVSTTGLCAGASAAYLRQAGYDAFALDGGLAAWSHDGQPLVPGKAR